MVLGRISGTVVSTVKHPAYQGLKLLLVEPLRLANAAPDDPFVAVDHAQAGVGDTVLVLREGSGARQVLDITDAPIISVIVGIIDSVTLEG